MIRRQLGGLPWPIALLLWLLAVLATLLVLVLFTPAGAISLALERSGADVRLLAPGGRLHAGSGQLLLGSRDLGRLGWRLRPGQLWRGRVGLDVTLDSDGRRLSGRFAAGRGGIVAGPVTGVIDEPGLRALLAPYEIHPSGRVTLEEAGLHFSDGSVVAAYGAAHWTGGPVRYVLGTETFAADFPPLTAALHLHGQRPLLRLLDPDGSELLDATIDADGWAHLRLRARFVAMAAFPWPEQTAPDTILVELSERMF